MSNKEQIKVLHYIKHLESGGGEALLLNIHKNIDRKKYQFDYLVNTNKKELLDDKFIELGGNIIPLMDNEPKSILIKIIKASRNLYKLLKSNKYNVFHVHCSNGQGLIYCWIAKKAKVKNVVVHIHNTNVDGKLIHLKELVHNVCKNLFLNTPTKYVACSMLAAKWLYNDEIINSDKFYLVSNGIDVSKYKFNEEIRFKIRNELGWNKKKIILNIGRMEQQKNQVFLLETFKDLAKDDDYRLLIIGRGSLEKDLLDKIDKFKLNDKVKIINYSNEVEKYLWAADAFILPSLYEGLGIVAIESQASGLLTFISDGVPKEVELTDLINRFNLVDGPSSLANTIGSHFVNIKDREKYNDIILKSNYDIKTTIKEIEKVYTK